MLDLACLLECASPMLTPWFLPIAAVANTVKNISWLSASATRAGIHQSLATEGTLADVTAKAGSQSILGSVLGTGVGIGVASMIPWASGVLGLSESWVTVLAFMGLSAGHISTLLLALRKVVLPTLNAERTSICATAGILSGCSRSDGSMPACVAVPHPELVSKVEGMWPMESIRGWGGRWGRSAMKRLAPVGVTPSAYRLKDASSATNHSVHASAM